MYNLLHEYCLRLRIDDRAGESLIEFAKANGLPIKRVAVPFSYASVHPMRPGIQYIHSENNSIIGAIVHEWDDDGNRFLNEIHEDGEWFAFSEIEKIKEWPIQKIDRITSHIEDLESKTSIIHYDDKSDNGVTSAIYVIKAVKGLTIIDERIKYPNHPRLPSTVVLICVYKGRHIRLMIQDGYFSNSLRLGPDAVHLTCQCLPGNTEIVTEIINKVFKAITLRFDHPVEPKDEQPPTTVYIEQKFPVVTAHVGQEFEIPTTPTIKKSWWKRIFD